MLREFKKATEFKLTRGRCVVVYVPGDIDHTNFHELLDEVIIVDDEYLVATDVRYTMIDRHPEGGFVISSNGIPFLGFLVRPAGLRETAMYTVFGY